MDGSHSFLQNLQGCVVTKIPLHAHTPTRYHPPIDLNKAAGI